MARVPSVQNALSPNLTAAKIVEVLGITSQYLLAVDDDAEMLGNEGHSVRRTHSSHPLLPCADVRVEEGCLNLDVPLASTLRSVSSQF